MADLKTNYKDDVLDTSKNTKRKYKMIQNADGTVSFEDVTVYKQEGDSFGGADINATNEFCNSLNQSKVGTDILGDIKEVCNDIVTTSKNVALDPNSAYLFISWQNVNGNVNQPCMMLLLTCASTITQVTIYGTPLNIWKMLPTSGLTQGIYAKDGYYNHTKIVKL